MSAYSDAVLADAPLSYWRLGELTGATAADSAGSNPGTLSAGITQGVPGAILADSNAAMTFNGTNGQISVADTTALRLNQSAWSVEYWFWAAVLPGAGIYPAMLMKGNGATSGSGYEIFLSGDTNAVALKRDNLTFGGGTIMAANWYYTVWVYDPTRTSDVVSFYLQGAFVGSSGPISNFATDTAATGLWIGGTRKWNGRLDEVAIYPSALTIGRIQAHYNAITTPSPPATVTTGSY